MKYLNFNNHSVLNTEKKGGGAMRNIDLNPSISLPGQRSRVESLTRRVLAGLIVLFSFAAGAQTTRYVDASVSGGDGSGDSWANAYESLSDALAAADDGLTLFVKAGTYKPTSGTDRAETFAIPAGVSVYGGFAGTETTLAERDLSTAGKTILSGDIGTAVGADPTDLDDEGYDDNVYHVVTMAGADAILDGFTVEAGTADGSGTGENVGGGVYAATAVSLLNLEVRYNQASQNGGGMFLSNSSSGDITVANCTVYNNGSDINGGGMFLSNSSTGEVTAVNCTLYNNEANTSGGGIYFFNFSTGNVTAANCTVYDNEASVFGGGMYLVNNSTGDLTVANGIIYNNTASISGDDAYNDSSSTDILFSHCLLGTAVAGNATAGTDYTLTAAVSGDPLFTSTTASDANFLRLRPSSPAVDAGNNSLVPDGITTDLAGDTRIQDGDDDNTATVNLGAYESTIAPPLYVDAGASGDDDGTSWANAYPSLTDALAAASDGDLVFVKAGTYKPTSGTDRAATFDIPAGVGVYGGFAGTETSLAERDLSAGNKTILSGDIGVAITTLGDFDDAGYDDNVYHVVTMEGAGAILDGFTVEAGNADDGLDATNNKDHGGGVFVGAAVSLANLALRYNQANGFGGGMSISHNGSEEITVANCTIYGNGAGSGGGMRLANFGSGAGTITTVNSTFYNNEASSSGGGIFFANLSSGEMNAVNCTIYNNEASSNGGGMVLSSTSTGEVTVANCISYGNTASNTGDDVYNAFTNTNTLVSHCLLGTAVAGNPTAGTDYTLTAPVSGDPMFVSTTAGDAEFLRLQGSSPAVDAGDNSLLPDGITTDLAGDSRIQDGDGDNTATVDVGAYERPSPDVVLATPAPSVDEHASPGEAVSILNVINTSIVSFAVSEGGAKSGNFEVVDDNDTWKLQVATGANLDYEALSGTTPAYTIELSIQGKDAAAGSGNDVGMPVTVAITINDVNEPATGIDLSGSAVAENSDEDTEVGMLSATGDPESDSHTFSFASSDPVLDSEGNALASGSGLFKIVGDKLQRGAELLDYEALPEPTTGFTAGDAKEITLRLTAIDNGTPPATSEVLEVTVEVSNVDEMPEVPTLSLTSGSVATYTNNTVEITAVAAAGDALLTAESTDPEGENVMYSLEAVSPTTSTELDALIVIDETTGIITLVKALDEADNGTHTFKVVASDGDLSAETAEQTLAIDIDVVAPPNEAPSVPTLMEAANAPDGVSYGNETLTITADAAVDDALLTAESTDPDGDDVTYSLEPVAPSGAGLLDTLAMDANTGIITLKVALTASDNGMHTFKVVASDGDLSAETETQTLEIDIVEPPIGNEAPSVPTLTEADGVDYGNDILTITADVAVDDALLTAASTDPDGDDVTYSLEPVAPSGAGLLDTLAMDASTGIITLKVALTASDNGTHTFKVVASDGDLMAETVTQTLAIDIDDDEVNPTLGLSDADGYVVYPNPVGGDESLQILAAQSGDRVEMVDLEGHLLVSRTVRSGNEQLSVANLPAGTYLLIITPANGKGTKSTVLRFVRE